MGLQVSCCVYIQGAEESPVRKDIQIFWAGVSSLARQRGSQISEGHMVADHVHMLIRIPPKYAVAEVVGYLKGKSAIAVARQFAGRKRNFNGEKFWARGYAVSTVGFEEEQIQKYICHQESLDTKGYDQKEGDHDDDNKDDGKF